MSDYTLVNTSDDGIDQPPPAKQPRYGERVLSEPRTSYDNRAFSPQELNFVDHVYSSPPSSVASSWLPSSSTNNGSTEFSNKTKKYNQLNVDSLKAKLLEVGELKAKYFETPKGDIGYHFELSDETDNFEEGEIVGFVANKEGKYEAVQKLNLQNFVDATIKGVVTRSQYFEAHVPKDNSRKTEIVCMYGSVPVRVKGRVEPDDSLYASPRHPGYAVSGREIDKRHINLKYGFVGTATQGTINGGMVQALVSHFDNMADNHVAEKLGNFGDEVDGKLYTLRKKSKKWQKRCICSLLVVLVMVTLILILLWQIYFPGTAFRYWRCRRGHKQPLVSAWFEFIPYRDTSKKVKSAGIEFYFNDMAKKLHYSSENFEPFENDMRYFVNIDRCAYGGPHSVDTGSGVKEEMSGPNVFAIDRECNQVYYHNGNPPAHWKLYNSARWDTYCNVFCDPLPVNRTQCILTTRPLRAQRT